MNKDFKYFCLIFWAVFFAILSVVVVDVMCGIFLTSSTVKEYELGRWYLIEGNNKIMRTPKGWVYNETYIPDIAYEMKWKKVFEKKNKS